LAIADLAQLVLTFGSKHEPVEGYAGVAQTSRAPSAAAHLAHVRVDEETGETEVLGYVVAQDCGRAINPALVEGQMRGGVAQGIGWALLEELRHDEEGNLLTGSFMTYAVPRSEHIPPIEAILVEVPAPEGAYGAKGVGEACLVPGPAAIANGITAATGARLRQLPMSPPRVWRALRDARAEPAAR
jgi:CO/xanthine dehydrogenase Mo-binding subunit